ncbi:MAG: TetR/AcrR family transcriptional regulator [Burkholderiaceae bacterium]
MSRNPSSAITPSPVKETAKVAGAPRSKAAQSAQSVQALLASARTLFETAGYAGTSTEALLAQTGLTRGALYHHFRDKKDLFAAVVEQMHQELAAAIDAATLNVTDAADALRKGSHAWLRAIAQPTYAQVLLIDASAVLGTLDWHAADARHGFAQLLEGVRALEGESGAKTTARTEALAVALNGALNELARWVAEDRTRLNAALKTIDRLLDAVAADA